MARIIGIDFGTKRVGLAVTDSLQIAAHGLTTVPMEDAVSYIARYMKEEPVEKIVIGVPNRPSTLFSTALKLFVRSLNKNCPGVELVYESEDFTSVDAMSAMRRGGAKKKDRMNKNYIDQVSAIFILQRHLGHLN